MKSAFLVIAILIAGIAGIVLMIFLIPVGDLPPRPSTVADNKDDWSTRFEISSHHIVSGDLKIQVFKDTETDVEYLVLWPRKDYRGPAMCRLWSADKLEIQ